MKEYSKNKKVDRKDWPPGPWDSEPDFHEWTTVVGYEAYVGRLDSGALFGVVIAPYPTECTMGLAFSHTLRDMRYARWYHDRKDMFTPGCISKTDIEGVGEWTMSMEHYQSPGVSIYRTHTRGPYKTLQEVVEIVESMAKDIFDIHKEGTYVNYFRH